MDATKSWVIPWNKASQESAYAFLIIVRSDICAPNYIVRSA